MMKLGPARKVLAFLVSKLLASIVGILVDKICKWKHSSLSFLLEYYMPLLVGSIVHV